MLVLYGFFTYNLKLIFGPSGTYGRYLFLVSVASIDLVFLLTLEGSLYFVGLHYQQVLVTPSL